VNRSEEEEDVMVAGRVSVALVYKNFGLNKGVSHIGLGVAALNTAKSLRRAGVDAHVWPIVNPADLKALLAQHSHITHVVVSAPWIPTVELQRLGLKYPNVEFCVNCHSNVGFLQADSNGVQVFKELLHAEHGSWNLHVAGNSEKFVRWVQDTFETHCAYLPNLYYLDHTAREMPPLYAGGTLKIGAFGATRPLKNLMSAAAAAMELAAQLRVDLQFWISGGREDGGGVMIRAIRKLFEGESTRRLHEAHWAPWPEFKTKFVRPMHLLMQPSYTESFNMVTADGISMGVPSVVSHAIDWAPRHWQANADDVFDLTRVARHLLQDRHAVRDGLRALEVHNAAGLRAWLAYLHGHGQHSVVHGDAT
jgi:hypothetical protein